MKKFLFVLLTAIAVLSFTACDKDKDAKSNDSTELIYNLTATADGQVEFSWFNGGAKVNGSAELYQCNDTINKDIDSVAIEKATTLADALKSNDAETAKLADKVNSLIIVNSAEGNYHLKIVGYVKYGPIFLRINEEYPKEVD